MQFHFFPRDPDAPSISIRPLSLKSLAIHEAAHAVAALVVGEVVAKVEVCASGRGRCVIGRRDAAMLSRRDLRAFLCVNLAPAVFFAIHARHRHEDRHYDGDEWQRERWYLDQEWLEGHEPAAKARMRRLFAQPATKNAVMALAQALMRRKALSGKDATSIIRRHIPS